ncbi:MAG TPA: AbrB/MazE/SpoVT family DNA-binding domain-containing protein [Chloroflexota bacterium]|nr:AbrB/MazE/SpoVT family DNA-binding domain-containing protein [Chloroflexota bacterium]
MALRKHDEATDVEVTGGFGTVDEKGRISLPKPIRDALGIQPGSAVALILINGAVMIFPQDEQLVRLMEEARLSLEASGLTVQDLLDDLPRVRDELMNETYGPEFMAELQRKWDEIHRGDDDKSAT